MVIITGSYQLRDKESTEGWKIRNSWRNLPKNRIPPGITSS
jgi:hypothetical protein